MPRVAVRALELWQRFRASRWYRLAELGILTASLAVMLYALIKNLSKVDLSIFRFDVSSFFVAIALTWLAVWLGALAWAQILRSIQPKMQYSVSIRSHMLSIATKYLPGLGWQQVSKVVQLKNEHISVRLTVSAVIFEFALVIFTGLATAAQILLMIKQNVFGLDIPYNLMAGIALTLWMVCLFIPLGWVWIQLRSLLPDFDLSLYLRHMLLTILLQVVSWLVFSAGLWFVCSSIYPVGIESLPYFMISLMLSVIIGILVIVSPNGFGVRELIMLVLLQSYVPLSIGITVAIMSRLVLILAEILAALPFILRRYWHVSSKSAY